MKLSIVTVLGASILLGMSSGQKLAWLHDPKPAGKCTPVVCAKKGEFCSKCTVCMGGTSCIDGECRLNVGGDICASECSDAGLYCNRTRCMARLAEGQACMFKRDACGADLYCDATITERLGVCRRYPGEGETCRDHRCREGYDCEYDEIDEFGVCRRSPRAPGEACSRGHGCGGVELGLFCNVSDVDEEGRVREMFKFNGVCTALPGVNEDCMASGMCQSGCECVEYTCVKNPAPKNGYCDNKKVFCEPGLACFDNVCGDSIKFGGECSMDSECLNYPRSFCIQNKCIPAMSVNESGECFHSTHDEYGVYGTVQCGDGLGCVPDNRSSSGFMCKPIVTELASVLKCDGDRVVCPEDSFCGCNDGNGVVQCIPYMKSSPALLERYERLVNGRDRGADAEVVAALRPVVGKALGHDSYYRCGSWEKKFGAAASAAPAVLPAALASLVVMMVVAVMLF